jgi:CheY-like chemotaxis protein/HPt (histidine-containing phosphotransfer) domain-containing protein
MTAYLSKPIKQSELFDVVVRAISEPVPEKSIDPKPRKKARRTQRELSILVAEDNQVNQLLAMRVLEKLGHRVTVVSNGLEALSSAKTGRFDLIAMDVQMPEMDGLSATAAIREWEKTSGTHIPVIAMTAHAMKEDRERCLAAGMDAYTSKPIRVRELQQAITSLVGEAESAKTSGSQAAKAEADAKIDRTALLAGFDGNRSLLGEISRVFLNDYPLRLSEIREAIRKVDAPMLARVAHALKGAIGNFGAKLAFTVAEQLETMGKNGDLSGADALCVTLESELALVARELKKLTGSRSKRTLTTDKEV